MNVDLQKTFPYSKDELNATMATVSIYVVSIIKGALPQHRLELKKGYFQCLYPLYAIWEEYGYGSLEEVCIDKSMLPYYYAFKTIACEVLEPFIPGIQNENPFAWPYAPFENTEPLIKKLVNMYQDLLDNLKKGNLCFNELHN